MRKFLSKIRFFDALYLVLVLTVVALVVIALAVAFTDISQNLLVVPPLVGALFAGAAGIQELGRRRQARIDQSEQVAAQRKKEIRQREREDLRRLDQQFTNATKGLASSAAAERVGPTAQLMFFLREENVSFRQQTYYYILVLLKSVGSDLEPCDRMLLRAFERAARLVLPQRFHECPPHGETPDRGRRRDGQVIPAAEMMGALDFSNACLQGVNLSGLELAEANLERSNLRGANLAKTCLWRARGAEAELERAYFRGANLEEAHMVDVVAPGADFTCASLESARFSPKTRRGAAVLRGASFVNARLQNACLDGAVLQDARFDGTNFKGASFHNVVLNEAARHSIVRTRQSNWRRAEWDDDEFIALERIAKEHKQGTKRPSVRPDDYRDYHYRLHPYPGYRAPHRLPAL